MRRTVAAQPRLVTRAAATALFACYLVGAMTALVLRAQAHEGVWQALMVPFTAFALVGWVIGWRRPQTPLGWIFLTIAFLTAVGIVGDSLVALAVHRGWSCRGLVMFAAWTQLWFWYPLIILATGYTLLLFPDGLPSRRWRPVLALLTIAVSVVTVLAALSPNVDFGKKQLPNPVGLHLSSGDIEKTPLFGVLSVAMAACVLAAIVSIGVRFHRSHRVERQQLKWFFFGAGALGMIFTTALVIPAFNNSAANNVLFPVALTCLPVACGLAIMRYRLYDIDRVVSRTVSYSVITGVVVGVYVGVVALIESGFGFSSSIAVAASTLAAAAVFQPLRLRVQRLVDRRFDRAAYDARRTVEAFSNRLRDQVDADAVRGDLVTTVSTAVAPVTVSVWLATS